MVLPVFALTSFKGGTGRTVAAANLAYQLALSGKDVCCVDLDLTSPSFGAVLDLAGLETGADEGVHDLLPRGTIDGPDLPPSLDAGNSIRLCKNVWSLTESKELDRSLAPDSGRFDLLPGKGEVDYVEGNYDAMAAALGEVLYELRDRYDAVFADLRSGKSDVLYALGNASLPGDAALDISWLVFYRWTPQHISGTATLIGELQDQFGADVRTVRTAYTPPGDYSARNLSWFEQQEAALERQRNSEFGAVPLIGTIPREDVLLWREGVITDEDWQAGHAAKETVDAYRVVLRRILDV